MRGWDRSAPLNNFDHKHFYCRGVLALLMVGKTITTPYLRIVKSYYEVCSNVQEAVAGGHLCIGSKLIMQGLKCSVEHCKSGFFKLEALYSCIIIFTACMICLYSYACNSYCHACMSCLYTSERKKLKRYVGMEACTYVNPTPHGCSMNTNNVGVWLT